MLNSDGAKLVLPISVRGLSLLLLSGPCLAVLFIGLVNFSGAGLAPVLAAESKIKLQMQKPQFDSLAAHSKTVKPVPTFLRGGLKITDAELESMLSVEPANDWFKIPSWLAGKWKYYEGEVLSFQDLRTGSKFSEFFVSHEDTTRDWGYQRDGAGAYWQFQDSPSSVQTRKDEKIILYTRNKNEPLSLTEDELVCRMFYTYSTLEPVTLKVLKTYQSENIVVFRKAGDDEIRRDMSSKIFDEDGVPLSLSTSYSLARRMTPFNPINSVRGLNTKALFRKFLTAHGMKDLLPAPGQDEDFEIW